jgi:hypothetical protein
MKKSEFKSYLKEEIFEILSEADQEDIDRQADLNKELEATKAHAADLGDSLSEKISQDVPTTGFPANFFYGDKVYVFHRILGDKAVYYNPREDGDYVTFKSREEIDSFLDDYNSAKGKVPRYESIKENVSQEVINKVSRFVTSLANYYDYSEQDAVYAIMQALRAHGAGFQGLNEEEMDDEEMDKQATSAAQKGDSISKTASKLGEITREMKSVVNQYKKSEEPEKSKHLARLKELTKIKKELEALL